MADDDQAEWLAWLDRWDALIAGLRGREGFADAFLDETHEEGCQEPMLGIQSLLGGHEQAMHELTPEEEDELWDLAHEEELDDEEVMNRWVRAKSVRNRPIRQMLPKRRLRGGGHGPGRGIPGKREFPPTWSDDRSIAHTMDVAKRPSGAVKLPSGVFRAYGQRDGVHLSVLVAPEGHVLTSYPVAGPGLVQNPVDDWRREPVERLQRLLDELVPQSDEEPRFSLDELMEVGEWPHVVSSLYEVGELTAEQRTELDELAYLASVAPG